MLTYYNQFVEHNFLFHLVIHIYMVPKWNNKNDIRLEVYAEYIF